MTEKALQLRWKEFWTRLGYGAQLHLFEELSNLYQEPHRAYHTLEHIGVCLQVFDGVHYLANRPESVEAAIWFHDVIYEIGAPDNELRSAEWAAARLQSILSETESSGRCNLSFCQRVHDLILVTEHKKVPQTSDGCLLNDIDLSTLGSSPREYMRYNKQIRQEFRNVPRALFARRRVSLLQEFLDRPTIYFTEYFQLRHETQARTNIQHEIKHLRQIHD